MAKLRVREPVVLFDAETAAHVVPHPSTYYESTDPLVKQHRWAFGTDDELAAAANPAKVPAKSA